MIQDLIADFAILLSFLFLSSLIFRKKLANSYFSLYRKLGMGMVHGLLGVVLMSFSVQLNASVIMDLRQIAIISAACMGGVVTSVTAALMMVIGRLTLFGGINKAAIIASIGILLISAGAGWIFGKGFTFWKKWGVSVLWTLIILSTNFLLVQGTSNLTGFLKYLLVIVLAGAFTASFIHFLTQAHEKKTIHEFISGLTHKFIDTRTAFDIYDVTLREMADVFDCDSGSIVIIDHQRFKGVVNYANGQLMRINHDVDPAFMEEVASRVLGGKIVVYADWNQQRAHMVLDQTLYEQGMRSSMHVPITYSGKTIAMINLVSRRVRHFTEREAGIVKELIPLASLSMALKDAEGKFNSIIESSHDAIILADSDCHIVLWSKGAERIFGYTEEEAVGSKLSRMIPEICRPANTKGGACEWTNIAASFFDKPVELEGKKKDRTAVPIELSLNSWQTGGVQYYSSIVRDMTERKKAERVILTLQQELASTLRNQEGIVLKFKKCGSRFVYTMAEGQLLYQFGFTPDMVTGKSVDELLPPQIASYVNEHYERAWQGENLQFDCELMGVTLLNSVNPVTEHGQVQEVVVLLSDITERKQAELQLRQANEMLQMLSSLDGLTGIANRRCFDEQIQECWSYAEEHAAALTVLLLDIDDFKAYNDTYGHQSGDACLKRVASVLEELSDLRGYFAARYGGEEFVCLLPGAEGAEAESFANEVCQAVRDLQVPHARSRTADYVTVSIGGATVVPTRLAAASELVEAADRSLYMAKSSGRNRVFISPDRNFSACRK